MNFVLYILAIMILYDLQLHIIETIIGDKQKAMKNQYYWPPAKIFCDDSDYFYNIFWTIYWLIAFILLFVYIIFYLI